jgi:N-acetylneuraminate synthase
MNLMEDIMDKNRVFIIAEIGINHNGDLAIAKKLIDGASMAGCDAVKFQKRTVDAVYTKEYLDGPRESPWGKTQRDQKEGLEFGKEEYAEIDKYCKEKGIEWFASAWDIGAQKFLQQFNLKYNKIASAMLTDKALLEEVAKEGRYTFIATGMSNYEEIDEAVSIFKKYNCPFELMHCNSTYPMKNEDANLRMINTLREKYNCRVGYSGHEVGRIVSMAAAVLGATSLERHITLDRTMYGSDQAASIEIDDLYRLVKDIRNLEAAMGTGEKVLSAAELEVRKKLRGN